MNRRKFLKNLATISGAVILPSATMKVISNNARRRQMAIDHYKMMEKTLLDDFRKREFYGVPWYVYESDGAIREINLNGIVSRIC